MPDKIPEFSEATLRALGAVQLGQLAERVANIQGNVAKAAGRGELLERAYFEGWALALIFGTEEEFRTGRIVIGIACLVMSIIFQTTVVYWRWIKTKIMGDVVAARFIAILTNPLWWFGTLAIFLVFVSLSRFAEEQKWPPFFGETPSAQEIARAVAAELGKPSPPSRPATSYEPRVLPMPYLKDVNPIPNNWNGKLVGLMLDVVPVVTVDKLRIFVDYKLSRGPQFVRAYIGEIDQPVKGQRRDIQLIYGNNDTENNWWWGDPAKSRDFQVQLPIMGGTFLPARITILPAVGSQEQHLYFELGFNHGPKREPFLIHIAEDWAGEWENEDSKP